MRGCRLSGPEDFDTLMLLIFSRNVDISFQNFFGFYFLVSEYTGKNCPNALFFFYVFGCCYRISTRVYCFNSLIQELVFRRLLIYFQNFLGFRYIQQQCSVVLSYLYCVFPFVPDFELFCIFSVCYAFLCTLSTADFYHVNL